MATQRGGEDAYFAIVTLTGTGQMLGVVSEYAYREALVRDPEFAKAWHNLEYYSSHLSIRQR